MSGNLRNIPGGHNAKLFSHYRLDMIDGILSGKKIRQALRNGYRY